MSTNTTTFINISERAYQYIRQFTIQTVEDALVELITNSFDAYNLSISIQRYVYIDIIDGHSIIVRDNALGMTSTQMQQCFLQVGDFTSSDTSRGFFSRGAKDISAIGNVIFDAIIDNSYSQCTLNTSAYGTITVADTPVTTTIRSKLQIPDPMNGVQVTLDLLSNYYITNYQQLYNTICNIAVLRDLIMDSKNHIIFRYINSGNVIFNQPIVFSYPTATNILTLKYNVPGYTNYTATFVVNKADAPIPQPLVDKQMVFGFLIKDDSTVYEINTIDNKYRWNPHINYLYGYLSSDGIKALLLEYDTNGPTETNPVPIIDPSRLTGVNRSHPFITALYSIATIRLDSILRSMNTSLSAASVSIEDINDLLDELGKYGVKIVETNNITVNFTPSYDGTLAQAINNDRSSYVTYEKSYEMTGQYTTTQTYTDNYVETQINTYNMINSISTSDTTNYYYIDSNTKEIRQIYNINDEQLPSTELTQLLTSDQINSLNVNPYIYKLSPNGNISKLYIFQKGHIDQIDPSTSNVIIPNKQFTIQFVNDLNSITRYTIDYTNGIVVNMNLNNAMVTKYLANRGINNLSTMLSLADLSSTQSLVFLRETMTQVFTDIIVNNDIITGKLVLSSSSSADNFQNEALYWNVVFSKIEESVDTIFQKYIQLNVTKKNNIVSSALDNYKTSVSQYLTSNYSNLAQNFITDYPIIGQNIESVLTDTISSIIE